MICIIGARLLQREPLYLALYHLTTEGKCGSARRVINRSPANAADSSDKSISISRSGLMTCVHGCVGAVDWELLLCVAQCCRSGVAGRTDGNRL